MKKHKTELEVEANGLALKNSKKWSGVQLILKKKRKKGRSWKNQIKSAKATTPKLPGGEKLLKFCSVNKKNWNFYNLHQSFLLHNIHEHMSHLAFNFFQLFVNVNLELKSDWYFFGLPKCSVESSYVENQQKIFLTYWLCYDKFFIGFWLLLIFNCFMTGFYMITASVMKGFTTFFLFTF